MKTWIIVGSVLNGLGIVLGAFASHALKEKLPANDLNIFESDLNIGNTEPLLSSILFNFVIFTPSIIILF